MVSRHLIYHEQVANKASNPCHMLNQSVVTGDEWLFPQAHKLAVKHFLPISSKLKRIGKDDILLITPDSSGLLV